MRPSRKKCRSAKTGKYVTKKAAKKHPATTVEETDRAFRRNLKRLNQNDHGNGGSNDDMG